MRCVGLLGIMVAACGVQPVANVVSTPPAGLEAAPSQLAFTCVNLGCDETKVVRVTVTGDRRVAVKRLVLTGLATADFSLTPSEKPPFILGPGASFELDVRYSPTGAPVAGTVAISVAYTDASPEESSSRLPAGELLVPLVRRLVGEPALVIAPSPLRFGVVPAGTRKTLDLSLSNGGFGNVALDIGGVDAGSSGLEVVLPPVRSMTADAGITAKITWGPKTGAYFQAELEVEVSTPRVPSARVFVDGTSLTTPLLAMTPAGLLDFGEVAKGRSRRLPFDVMNQGGADLNITRIVVVDPLGVLRLWRANGEGVALDGGASMVVAPVQREGLELELTGSVAGELNGSLRLTSNDPAAAVTVVPLRGTVTQPKVSVSPLTLDFGVVPQGWVVTKPIEVRNVGFGTLTVKSVGFVGGASSLYSLVNVPALPLQLSRDQRVALELQFRAETVATFKASVSVETDDDQNVFAELAATARVGTCDESCPITNGSAACSGGVCAIGACNASWFDTDGVSSNGCECHDLTADPGEFCADSTDIGTLRDKDKAQRSFTGLLPAANDVDVLRFFAEDASQLFGDDYQVRVRLESSDPGIGLCLYRHDTASHQSECYFDNVECPANRTYKRDGTAVKEDGAEFIVKVIRLASTAPTCTTYTVFMSNGL